MNAVTRLYQPDEDPSSWIGDPRLTRHSMFFGTRIIVARLFDTGHFCVNRKTCIPDVVDREHDYIIDDELVERYADQVEMRQSIQNVASTVLAESGYGMTVRAPRGYPISRSMITCTIIRKVDQ